MQSSEQLKRFAPFALAIGLGALVMAGVIWAITRQVDVYVQGSLAVGLLGLALSALFNPEAIQKWLMGRQARYGGNVSVMVIAFIGIVVVINYLTYKNPVHWDLSQDQVNTLAPETLEALKQLSQPVKATGFYTLQNFGSQRQTTEDLLKRFAIESQNKFTYEFIDPTSDPVTAQAYNITRDGTLVLEAGGAREELSFATEAEITGALIRFAHPTTRTVYFLTGHGERDIADTSENGISQMVDLLKKQNYVVQTLNLQVTTTVPADARAVIVAGPLVPVSAEEATVLGNYLRYNSSTALIVLMDTPIQTQMQVGDPEPLVTYLNTEWGINLPQDVVVDLTNSYPNQPYFPFNDGYENSPITTKLQDISTVYPIARSVAVVGTAETFPGITYTPLIKTAADAWGETNFQALLDRQAPEKGEGDNLGPLWLAVAAQHTEFKSRLVVFGDSDFASNASSELGANSLLFLNTVNWATAEESLINLTPKVPTTRTLVLRDTLTANFIAFFTVIVMPLAVLVAGIVVWVLRRRHV